MDFSFPLHSDDFFIISDSSLSFVARASILDFTLRTLQYDMTKALDSSTVAFEEVATLFLSTSNAITELCAFEPLS